MIKTPIQIPEELFRELRAFAKQRKWSLAETFRRRAGLLLHVYLNRSPQEPTDDPWTPPSSNQVGWRGRSAEQLREASFADGDPRLA